PHAGTALRAASRADFLRRFGVGGARKDEGGRERRGEFTKTDHEKGRPGPGPLLDFEFQKHFPSLRGDAVMRILLTGGMGFIGSHTAVTLLEAGHHVVLYDNLSNADAGVAARIEKITGRAP
ncbi:hypothetical protein HMPREF9440_02003, partial [Sutterella parvirubra YIT 11816]